MNGKKGAFEAEGSQQFVKIVQEYIRKSPIASSQEEDINVNDFPPLDAEKHRQVFYWLSGQCVETVLNTKFNLSITRRDIQTLNWSPLRWLNDEVINFYMELLCERSLQNENLPKVHSMNTFFLSHLMAKGYNKVRKWTRNVDVFSFDIILVPVHMGVHWGMATIDMRNKTIKYYDSIGILNNQALNALIGYLRMESLDKKEKEFDLTDWTTENVQNNPKQENDSDCGVFSCMYAEFIARNRPIIFTQENMQYFREKMIYEICTGQMLN